jgi:hypothetical protein
VTLRRRAAALTLLGAVVVGCGGAGSTPAVSSAARTPPDLAALLRQPVATPSVCTSENASTYKQRRSPWVGHIDLSVFLRARTTPAAVKGIGRALRRTSTVQHVYFESNHKAYAEFQRLYTCWAAVPRSQTPASYRVVLKPTATISQRDSLVARMVHDPGVGSVSCDPSLPCTDVVQSAAAQRR